MIDVIYDSFSLQDNSGITVSGLGAYNTPPRDIQIENIAGADGGILVESRYRSKAIPVSGTIMGDTQLELETRIQTFKRALNKSQKELRITDEGDYMTLIATPGPITIIRERGLTRAEFAFEFMCADPFATFGVETTLLSTNVTATGQTYAIDVGGSYKTEPSILITLNTVAGAGDRTVAIQNGKTFAGITVDRTWANGDELEIDSGALTVKVNGVETEYTGLFPSWEAGLGSVYFNDSFTSRDIDILITYTQRKI